MAISHRKSRFAIALLFLVSVCGCSPQQPPTVPAGIPVPNGWAVLAAESNGELSFEGATFYARFESPQPPDKAALSYGNAMLAADAKGHDLQGPVKLSDSERNQYQDHQSGFERKHSVDRSNYPIGWKVSLSNEPSYYQIYAYPHEKGSVVELISISAL